VRVTDNIDMDLVNGRWLITIHELDDDGNFDEVCIPAKSIIEAIRTAAPELLKEE
jgi:hypothetical protein